MFKMTGNIVMRISILLLFLINSTAFAYNCDLAVVIMIKNEASVIEDTLRPFVKAGIYAPPCVAWMDSSAQDFSLFAIDIIGW